MPKPRTNDLIHGTYFNWILRQREGVYFADGRSNQPSTGRHSLGVRDRAQAIETIRELDLAKAVEFGRADRRLLSQAAGKPLDLEPGRVLYEAHVRRPAIAGGARPVTSKRYKAVFDKFLLFAAESGIKTWNQVTLHLLTSYAAYLDDQGKAPRTEYLELTTIRQAMKWFVENGHLPASCLFRMDLKKPEGTDTYCWRLEEVKAIILHCRSNPELHWLGGVFTALISTGLRISELAALRWSDIDRSANILRLTDEGGRTRDAVTVRRTKSGRGRVLPIHEDLKPILDQMPRLKDGNVFHGPLGGVLKPDTVRNILIREVLSALASRFPTPKGEIGFAHGRLHSCRHFFCSQCVSEGIAEQVVMSWLGHRDSKMVRHYFHLHNETAQRHMSRLRLLGEAGGPDAVSTIPCVEPKAEYG